jgi:enoyl-CoA hydratase
MTDASVLVQFPAQRADGGAVDHVALATISRPAALNALTGALMHDLVSALERLDGDPACHAVVIRGAGERAFVAGADIREMADLAPDSPDLARAFAPWARLPRIGLPLIAAVRGYALGGGCELALACDIIVAGDDAQFGQPEVRLGIMPGAGGTQRLTRAVGRARAMELILTGRTFSAADAERWGMVSMVVPAETTFEAALDLAGRIAGQPAASVRAAKAAIADAEEQPLSAGLAREQRAFFNLFAT